MENLIGGILIIITIITVIVTPYTIVIIITVVILPPSVLEVCCNWSWKGVEIFPQGERDPGTSVLKETGVLINVGKRRMKIV